MVWLIIKIRYPVHPETRHPGKVAIGNFIRDLMYCDAFQFSRNPIDPILNPCYSANWRIRHGEQVQDDVFNFFKVEIVYDVLRLTFLFIIFLLLFN